MTTVLLAVDLQLDYFEGGAMPLPTADVAVERAAEVFAAFRQVGAPVVHLQHVWDEPEATFMRPGTPGVELHPKAYPVDGEVLITKESPNGFVGTDLEKRLDSLDVSELVVMGMMTQMCVDATVRAASDLGHRVIVVHDACAAADLSFAGVDVPAEQVHAAFLAALGDGYATVSSALDVTGSVARAQADDIDSSL